MKEVKVKKPRKRGSFGYIATKKKAYLAKVFVYVLLGIGIFGLGYVLNKRTTSNVFTIIAILMVLPGAKALVAFIVFAPFRTVDIKRYEKVYQILAEKVIKPRKMEEVMADTIVAEQVLSLYTDIVFTSPQKVMNFDFLILAENRGIALAGKEKQDIAYMETYLKEGLAARGIVYGMKVYSSEEQFLKALQALYIKESHNEGRPEVVEYLESLIVV